MSTTTTQNTDPRAVIEDTTMDPAAAHLGGAGAAALADATTGLTPFPEHWSKRTEVYRRNAKKSTGPRTKEGKSKVSMNALKHGLTAKPLVLPGEDPAALQERIEIWKDGLKPRNPVEDLLAERLAHATWRADRADRAIAERLTYIMLYAVADELAAEVDEVEDLGRRLYWDPRGPLPLYPHGRGFRPTPRISSPESVEDPLNPARIVNQIEMTATGCRWLLERWGELQKLLEAGLKWQGPDRFNAIRMLGRQPMDAADDRRVLRIYLAHDAMSPGEDTSLADLRCETTDAEGKRLGDRVLGRDADGSQPADQARAVGCCWGWWRRRRVGWRSCWRVTWSAGRRCDWRGSRSTRRRRGSWRGGTSWVRPGGAPGGQPVLQGAQGDRCAGGGGVGTGRRRGGIRCGAGSA